MSQDERLYQPLIETIRENNRVIGCLTKLGKHQADMIHIAVEGLIHTGAIADQSECLKSVHETLVRMREVGEEIATIKI